MERANQSPILFITKCLLLRGLDRIIAKKKVPFISSIRLAKCIQSFMMIDSVRSKGECRKE